MKQPKEYLAGEILRCGRCTGVLPDETLSFCPHCGVLFSTVPPTNAYCDLKEHQYQQEKKRHFLKYSLGFMTIFCLGFFLYLSVYKLYQQQLLEHLSVDRKLVVYVGQKNSFPTYNMSIIREAILTGVQSFEDHFGIPIKNWEIHEGQSPKIIESAMTLNEENLWQQLSFWKSFFSKESLALWQRNPYGDLNVYISNFPIYWKNTDSGKIEAKHLSSSGLVSGLGHPSMVVLSTYRAQTEWKFLKETEAAKFIGEYVMAHELGHALLGFFDYVVPPQHNQVNMRQPASIQDEKYENCLMHTDQGGGYEAWQQIQKRQIGVSALCHQYSDLLLAHHLRNEAILKAQQNQIPEAQEKISEALAKISGKLNPWVEKLWKQEKELIDSL